LVKNFLKSGNLKGILEKDFYGNVNKPFKSLGKMITASDVELQVNPRSRSAKLRIGERTA
jgi:16S rRNA (cytosine1402-N4)-methyltransferase